MTEYNVAHQVTQIVEADNPEDAELIARRAIEHAHGLWWASVTDTYDVMEVE